eukprot:CAMPEP_0202842152 /NCGR_PEP_ID=MMETSP1389-20130828/60617_1 /ASSEMBLY_ACC=CAM_ASM_000865 /TAXON_ID=302021 /ORGANISM="Rhodomonas sp., Strain CCMP768" /LENGTH=200 /DNA_ID=CAMNT_0049519069 /DNA_START=68 /DNA_END=671 /DNA_ORIENTATION=-
MALALAVSELGDVNVHIRPVPLHGHDVEVAPEGACVDAAEGEPVRKASHHLPPRLLRDLLQLLLGVAGGGERVRPQPLHAGEGDAAALVGDLDCHVLVPVRDHHRHRLDEVWLVLVSLDDGAHGVLEELEENVVQVLRDVRQRHVCRTLQLDLGRDAVAHLADAPRVLHRVHAHLSRLALLLDDADEALLWVVQHDVLPD